MSLYSSKREYTFFHKQESLHNNCSNNAMQKRAIDRTPSLQVSGNMNGVISPSHSVSMILESNITHGNRSISQCQATVKK
ncbi:hypothetical protein ACHAW6_000299 [Cyclotella cf. meneghiniana]